MRNILSTTLIMAMLIGAPTALGQNQLTPGPQELTGVNHYVGEIAIFAGNFAPHGFAFCEGQIIKLPEYTPLFDLIGNRYGGDGRTTFALPNLKDAEKSLGGARYIISLDGTWPSRY
jgi:microcystin-dependent protein